MAHLGRLSLEEPNSCVMDLSEDVVMLRIHGV